MREELVKELAKRLKRGERIYRLEAYLESKGYSEATVEAYIQAALNSVDGKSVSLNRTKVAKGIFIGSVLTFLGAVYYFFGDASTGTITSSTFRSVMGGILISTSAYLSWLFHFVWRKPKDGNASYAYPDWSASSILGIFVISISAIILGFILDSTYEDHNHSVLRESGVLTKARVISVSFDNFGKRDDSSVSLLWRDQSGNRREESFPEIRERLYMYPKGREIYVIYDPTYPHNFLPLLRDSQIQAATGSAQRDFTIADLMSLMQMTEEERLEKLNQIHFGWEYNNANHSYTNKLQSGVVEIYRGRVRVITQRISPSHINYEQKKLGFEVTEVLPKNRWSLQDYTAESDQYRLNYTHRNEGGSLFFELELTAKVDEP